MATQEQKYDGFTADERAAMKDRAKEIKSRGKKVDTEAELLAKIAEFTEGDKADAERVHALVKENAPHLQPKLWYGMPAYYRDGKLVCHFSPAAKFKTRYSTFNFSDNAAIDDGDCWPIGFALGNLTPAVEAKLAELIKQAAS
ncbi:hypothetical protein Afil01_47730 [Actinorhabdospora filicis]|uniref:YdhG-like domain-containing protein n=1 Tax=Actinorhabdospora filicis TaxID=1785913 RepID=A0A9W6SPS1_9ACTN|nr:DUF1801 domain-containing protein [Actinorhabdospora filicis]GLZ79966.1 hypothetical protein Afil01_47730 [Actinorhabdospora filicis]